MLDDVDVDIDDHADGGGGDDAQPALTRSSNGLINQDSFQLRPNSSKIPLSRIQTTPAQETCSTDLFDRD